MIMINWLRRLICGECDCSKKEHRSKYGTEQDDKWVLKLKEGENRSKYAPERDIDTVKNGSYSTRPVSNSKSKTVKAIL